MKTLIGLLSLLLISFSLSLPILASAATSEVKIGYVDLKKAVQETKAGKKAKASLEKHFKNKKKELAKLESDLKKMNEDLEKKSLVLSDDVRAKKQQELQKEMMKYQELVGKSQLEIQKKERDLIAPIYKKLRGIISKLAEKEGYTMVIEKGEQAVLWAKKEIDLTAKVIKEFNK